ncbi:MAG: hypothetical protein HFI86_08560 [Bacilli bacterium]|nr:hypothetical protein [Bacilli bacterium]
MNIISDNFFKFDINVNRQVTSALIKCLEHEKDIDLYKKWIAKEYNLAVNDDKVYDRTNLVIKLKDRIDKLSSSNDRNQIVQFLSRLLAAKFSGRKQSDSMIELTLEKLIYCFENKAPIIFVFGFGGYKNYNSPAFPEVDYAELFHMKYMTEFLWPIITTYKYGVKFEYESEEVSIQFNNVPQETTDKYTISFEKLLNYFVKKVEEQNGIKLDYKLVIARYMYDTKDLYKKMEEYYPSMLDEFNKLPNEEKDVWIKRARTNFLIKGNNDYSNLSIDELNNKFIEARVNNECFLAADYDLRIDFWERMNSISLFGTWGKTPCASPTDGGLHLKSTRFSNTDFWIGTGVFKLDENNNILEELILSHTQYNDKKDSIKFLESDNDELKQISRNFNLFPYIR